MVLHVTPRGDNGRFVSEIATLSKHRSAEPSAPRPRSLTSSAQQGPPYSVVHAEYLSLAQLKIMSMVEHCGTAVLGGHVEACQDCGLWRIAYGKVSAAQCVTIGIVVYLLLLGLFAVWKRRFRYGPDEWLLRSWVDLKRKSFRV